MVEIANTMSQVVRIVDEGPGQPWGFWRAWASKELQVFLSNQGYTPDSRLEADMLCSLSAQTMEHQWPMNDKGRLPLLSLIGKGKFRIQVEIQ